MSKEVMKKEETQIANPVYQTSWGSETADSNDILVPKILLMQGLSKAVADGKARMGEMMDSLTSEILGSGIEKAEKPLRFFPLLLQKNWIVYEKLEGKGSKIQFKEAVPFSMANANWDREDDEERRDLTLNCYVMLPDQLDKDPNAFPYLLSFRRTSFKAGQKLSTHFTKAQLGLVPPASTIFELSARKTENDFGTFYVLDVVPVGKTKETHLEVGYKWYQTIKKGGVKVDEKDLQDVESEKVAIDESKAEY